MTRSDTCEDVQKAFAARRWRAAHDLFSVTHREAPLAAEDLERLAAYLIGEEREALELWAQLHQDSANCGRTDDAVRWAFWIGLFHVLAGRAS